MRDSAVSIGSLDKGRPYQQMEELSLEMASDDLVAQSGGAGLWKMLYDSMVGKLAADQEAEASQAANEGTTRLVVQTQTCERLSCAEKKCAWENFMYIQQKEG